MSDTDSRERHHAGLGTASSTRHQESTTASGIETAAAQSGSVTAQLLATEYDCLRTEVGRYQDHQKDLVHVAFVTFAAVLALVGALAQSSEGSAFPMANAAIVLLLAPIMYGLLAWTYFNRSFRIVELSQYTAFWLAPLAREVGALTTPSTYSNGVLHWETFKYTARVVRGHESKLTSRLPARLQLVGDLGPIYLVFIVPSVVAMVSYWKLIGGAYTPDNILLTAIDLLVLASCLRYIAPKPGRSSEEQGLAPPSWINELIAEHRTPFSELRISNTSER